MVEEVTIREFNPKLALDYLRFFDDIYDNDAFLNYKANPWWGGCYCTFYDDPRTEDEINASSDKRSENRENRRRTIEEGKASGLLAYENGRVVGWCNVAPRASYANPRYMKQLTTSPREGVGSITCFVVAQERRGTGIGSRLLSSACDLIKRWDLTIAEGYPRNPELANPYDIPSSNLSFHGSLNMFIRSGFNVHMKLDKFTVVRRTV